MSSHQDHDERGEVLHKASCQLGYFLIPIHHSPPPSQNHCIPTSASKRMMNSIISSQSWLGPYYVLTSSLVTDRHGTLHPPPPLNMTMNPRSSENYKPSVSLSMVKGLKIDLAQAPAAGISTRNMEKLMRGWDIWLSFLKIFNQHYKKCFVYSGMHSSIPTLTDLDSISSRQLLFFILHLQSPDLLWALRGEFSIFEHFHLSENR